MNTQPRSTNQSAAAGLHREDRDLVRDIQQGLAAEPLLGDCCIGAGSEDEMRAACVLYPEGFSGLIVVSADDGVVTLEGEVATLAEKRLAGRIAWRVLGCRDAVNALAVSGRSRFFGRPGGWTR